MINHSEIKCFRGPGRNFWGDTLTEKNIKRNEGVEWTGKWTTSIVEKIIEHDQIESRKEIIKNKDKVDRFRKDEIVIKLIKEYIELTGTKEKFNCSDIKRFIDNKIIFEKCIDRNYVKKILLEANFIKPDIKVEKVETDEEIVNRIKKLIVDECIFGYTRLTEVLIEKNFPLVGGRKGWNKVNVRDLCKRYNIIVY